LPYPSLFGCLATISSHFTYVNYCVAIPFSFRVSCNDLSASYFKNTDIEVAIPFSFRVSCNQESLMNQLYQNIGCHTLLFSGVLQRVANHRCPPFRMNVVAIPFSFRVSCNRDFFRSDWLKTYLGGLRF